MFFFIALPNSWSAFVKIQGKISNLTFTELISNILQQNAIDSFKTESSKTFAFYVKGRFVKSQNKSNHFQKASSSIIKSFKQSKRQIFSHSNTIYCIMTLSYLGIEEHECLGFERLERLEC